MKGNVIKNQGRHGFRSSLLSLRKAVLAYPKNNLHRVFIRVDDFRHFLFGFNTNRTSGIIEHSFAHFLTPLFG